MMALLKYAAETEPISKSFHQSISDGLIRQIDSILDTSSERIHSLPFSSRRLGVAEIGKPYYTTSRSSSSNPSNLTTMAGPNLEVFKVTLVLYTL